MELLFSICGIILYVILVIKNCSIYLGKREFFRIVQGKDCFSKKFAITLLEFPSSKDWHFLKENLDKDRPLTFENYSDDSLHGYADIELNKGGDNLEGQQRGLIFPLLENVLQEDPKRVLEIGTGNGDVIAYLANKYSRHTFIGIDLSIKNAQKKHRDISNLNFIKGYALDLIKDGLKGDIAFASSTFVLFLPKELRLYLKLVHNNFKYIILNEPTWGGYKQDSFSKESKYLGQGCWYHNYCGYLKEAGYSICNFEHFHYKHPISTTPDIFISLICAKNE